MRFWMVKNINDMEFTEREAAISNIIRSEDGLLKLYLGCAERLMNALFLINSGGAVALIAFLHLIQNPAKKWWIAFSLIVFLIGLVCAFVLVGADYLFVAHGFSKFGREKKNFLLAKAPFSSIGYFQMQKGCCVRAVVYWFSVYIPGGISFICAIIGVGIGIYGYFLR